MKRKTLEQTLFDMWTENTGTHMCDSGGEDGRNWQRNRKKTVEDFNSAPSASLSLELSKNGDLWACAYASMWHHLNATLELDDICHEFNAMEVEDWEGDKAYGLSAAGQDALDCLEAEWKDPWNTYNWENNWDAVLQGCNLEINGDSYVLIQYHGGADVRGGYTDAKLFKIADMMEDYFIYRDDVSGPRFEELDDGIDVRGNELVDHSRGCDISDEMKEFLINHYNLKAGGESVEITDCSACEY